MLRRLIQPQTSATSGAMTTIASGLTDWNQPVGNSQLPKLRLTMFSARKLNELPACSKNIQNSTLNANITSIAITRSRLIVPSRKPSTINAIATTTNNAPSSHASQYAPTYEINTYTIGATIAQPMITAIIVFVP